MDSLLDKMVAFARLVGPDATERLSDIWNYPFLTVPADRLYSGYLLTFVLIGAIICIARNKNSKIKLRTILKFVFPINIYLHKSAILDFKYYIINRILFRALFISYFVSGFLIVGDIIKGMLTLGFGQVSLSRELSALA